MKKKIIPNFLLIEGSKYKGELKDGKPHGQGTHTLVNGDKFVGQWINGQPKKGTMTSKGQIYVGQLKKIYDTVMALCHF